MKYTDEEEEKIKLWRQRFDKAHTPPGPTGWGENISFGGGFSDEEKERFTRNFFGGQTASRGNPFDPPRPKRPQSPESFSEYLHKMRKRLYGGLGGAPSDDFEYFKGNYRKKPSPTPPEPTVNFDQILRSPDLINQIIDGKVRLYNHSKNELKKMLHKVHPDVSKHPDAVKATMKVVSAMKGK